MNASGKCWLHSVNNVHHDPIFLEDGKQVILGRGPVTRVSDKRCSRKQVSVIANIQTSTVEVTHTGDNASGFNGAALKKGTTRSLQHNDRLELLLGEHIYRVVFDPPPKSQKRPLVNESTPKAKKLPTIPMEERTVNSALMSDTVSVKGAWQAVENGKLLIYTPEGLAGRSKIAGYDLDHTIITTKNGTVFPKDMDDWKIAFNEVPGKLKQLWCDGYKIVFFTNQAGIAQGKVKPQEFKMRISRITAKLGLPVQTFVSTGTGIFRKPAPGMWNRLVEEMNNGLEVDIDNSFYCGDAAGRVVNWAPKKKKDFSCADRLFAVNIGVKFYTPEEHFLNQRPGEFVMPSFNPAAITTLPLYEPQSTSLTLTSQELVLLVGYPGAGKSYFCKTYMIPAGYTHVNRDSLGTWQRCMSVAVAAMQGGSSVVIDNTNVDRESRRRFVEAAQKLRIVCRCFVLATSKEHAKHNNKFRELANGILKVNTGLIDLFALKFEEPTVDEGFREIVKINFVPHFSDAETEKLYKLYLIDK